MLPLTPGTNSLSWKAQRAEGVGRCLQPCPGRVTQTCCPSPSFQGRFIKPSRQRSIFHPSFLSSPGATPAPTS
uniref:Uncharacterized protein n=1 Tax=Junco hyemalis TaxID=40217 RepID=A0A8C5J609_JUNHY